METGIVYSYINELRIFLTGALGDAFLAEVVMTLLGIAVLLMVVMNAALVFTFGERKVCAFIQVRLGPNRVGPGGLLQPVADAMKLLSKEDIGSAVLHVRLRVEQQVWTHGLDACRRSASDV